jgi:hypothetical protein
VTAFVKCFRNYAEILQATFSGPDFERLGFRIGPRQQIVDGVVWVAVDDLGEHVGEIKSAKSNTSKPSQSRRKSSRLRFLTSDFSAPLDPLDVTPRRLLRELRREMRPAICHMLNGPE